MPHAERTGCLTAPPDGPAMMPNRLRIRILLVFLALMAPAVHYVIQVRYEYFQQMRIRHHQEVIAGLIMPPYRYRVLTPHVAEALRLAVKGFWSPSGPEQMQCFVSAYFCLVFVSFAITYQPFFAYLQQWFNPANALLGCLLLSAATPLTIPGFVDGDFVTLALVGRPYEDGSEARSL